MAHPKPFRIETPPPSLEETAKKLGLSEIEMRRTLRAVHDILARERTRTARKQRPRKSAAR